MYTVGSLFAGVGGIDIGFEMAGAKILWANELDPNACLTYRKNFNHQLFEGDINDYIKKAQNGDFQFPQVDILTAGFPCQAFSIAGYRKGFGDHRGNLFFSIMDVVKLIRPKILFLENVKNLRGHDSGRTFKIIKNTLTKAKYSFSDVLYNTMDYGNIPQNRERIYMVCLDRTYFKLGKTTNKHITSKIELDPISLDKTIHDLLDQDRKNEKYYYLPEHHYFGMLNDTMKNKDTVYQWRRVYVRENQSNVCPTLTANMGTGGHNVPLIRDSFGIRKLTPRECFRFQGFDDSFVLPKNLSNSHLYKQAGNSVSVPVISRIAQKTIDYCKTLKN
jgi:DNA (cytosine-5)-methyltransferase 1